MGEIYPSDWVVGVLERIDVPAPATVTYWQADLGRESWQGVSFPVSSNCYSSKGLIRTHGLFPGLKVTIR